MAVTKGSAGFPNPSPGPVIDGPTRIRLTRPRRRYGADLPAGAIYVADRDEAVRLVLAGSAVVEPEPEPEPVERAVVEEPVERAVVTRPTNTRPARRS